jgi:hypothetical protein
MKNEKGKGSRKKKTEKKKEIKQRKGRYGYSILLSM